VTDLVARVCSGRERWSYCAPHL